jgi:hypothetical protein
VQRIVQFEAFRGCSQDGDFNNARRQEACKDGERRKEP